jgi:predicted Zn-ribbon and HTH transcriptional regulator
MVDLVELYMEGLSIEEITFELGFWDEGEVISTLRELKRKDTNGKDYVHEFKEMVVERIVSGIKKGQVTKELGIAYRTINKYLNEFNADVPKNKREQEEQMFREIDWDSFSTCPDCKGTHVNDLNLYREEGIHQRNSYCLDCGSEWIDRGGRVYKVLWEFVK